MSAGRIRQRAVGASPALPGDLHPVVRRVLAARGITDAGQLRLELATILPVSRLGGLVPAVELLLRHRAAGSQLLVVGDFDADGATSTALVVLALRRLGFGCVDYLVPNRFEFGYGLTPEIVELAAGRSPGLIITVDNGVSSLPGVAAARQRGIDVLITDHHLPGALLPRANAIVDPNLPGSPTEGRSLAGVGVAFYLMAALARAIAEAELPGADSRGPPGIAELLDLVALGTVADLVPLDHTNRVLVAQGLKRIRAGRCRPGITALLALASRDRSGATSLDLGFALAPRLNAAGRLSDMRLGIECLLAEEAGRAAQLAAQLDRLNEERRTLERRMRDEAMTLAEAQLAPQLERDPPIALCLFDERWHQGVVGLVAARVRERLHRPVVAFARAGGDTLKGSARSLPALHIRDTLDAIAAAEPGLLEKFGGHAMAAGLSIAAPRLAEFQQRFEAAVRERLSPADLEGWLLTDGELAAAELAIDTARALAEAGPWGQGFPEPLFDGEFDVLERRTVGGRHCRLRLRSHGGGVVCDAIAFQQARLTAELPGRVRLAYRLGVDEYRGTSRLQLIVEHAEPV